MKVVILNEKRQQLNEINLLQFLTWNGKLGRVTLNRGTIYFLKSQINIFFYASNY